MLVKQDETKSSYHSFPSDEDFVARAQQWDARRMYNFIRGVGHWDRPIELIAGSDLFLVRDVLSYSLESRKDDYGEVAESINGTVWVGCKLGWVHAHPDLRRRIDKL